MGPVFPIRPWQLLWYILIFIIGFIGNGTVIFAIIKSKTIRRDAPFNIYLLALAITDITASVICIPTYVLSTSAFAHPDGMFGEILCKIVTGYFIPFWLLDVSVFLLVAITFERRKAILDPFSTLREYSIRKTLAYVGIVVLLGIFTQIPTIYGSHYATHNATIGNHCYYAYGETTMEVLHYNSFIWECIIPSLIFIICFRQIKKHLSKVTVTLQSSIKGYKKESKLNDKNNNGRKGKKERTSKNNSFTSKNIEHKKSTIETFKLVVIAFLLCVFVNEVMFMFLRPILNLTILEWNSVPYQVTVLLRFSNCCINPILYGFHSKTFRQKVIEVFNDTAIGKLHKSKQSKTIVRTYEKFAEVV